MEKGDNTIRDGRNYIVIKGSFMKLAKLKTQKQCQLGRMAVDVAGLLGHPVGTQFKLHPGTGKQRIMRPEPVEKTEDLADDIAPDESAADNRALVANQSSQALSREQIMEMRDQGATGKEIVNSIVDNSASFQGKTEYSQEKYVRKKQKKYFEFLSVHEPSVRLVASMYYIQDPLKIMNLRLDSLSQLLTACSVRAGARYLLLESGCLGLTVAAVLERLGGSGSLVHLFQGGTPQRHAVDAMNFTSEELACLSCVDLPTLMARFPSCSGTKPAAGNGIIATEGVPETEGTTAEVRDSAEDVKDTKKEDERVEESGKGEVDCVGMEVAPSATGGEATSSVTENATGAEGATGQSRKRRLSEEQAEAPLRKSKYARTRAEDSDLALELLSSEDMDGLLICCRQHPLNLVEYLLRFLAISRPFAVFCPYKEPLLECYFALKAKGCIMLRLTETWLRNYQVMPERTHPEINMSGGGGYILSGLRVDRSLGAGDTDC